MGIEIKITADTADEMRSEMRRLLGDGSPVYREPPIETQAFGPLPVMAPAFGKTDPATLPGGVRPEDFGAVGDGVADDTAAMQAAVNHAAAGTLAESPKRGRPRGSTKAALAAAAAPEPFVVRRYGGQIDSEHETAESAADRLRELMTDAADVAALDAVLSVNEALSEALPADQTHAITEAAESIRASLTAPAEEAAPPPVSIEPEVKPLLDLDKNPLTAITLNRRGAQNGVSAIVQRFGMVKAVGVLEKLELTKVSDITDDADPRLAALATEAAAMLGLPTVVA